MMGCGSFQFEFLLDNPCTNLRHSPSLPEPTDSTLKILWTCIVHIRE
jgi:hypothetical protein